MINMDALINQLIEDKKIYDNGPAIMIITDTDWAGHEDLLFAKLGSKPLVFVIRGVLTHMLLKKPINFPVTNVQYETNAWAYIDLRIEKLNDLNSSN